MDGGKVELLSLVSLVFILLHYHYSYKHYHQWYRYYFFFSLWTLIQMHKGVNTDNEVGLLTKPCMYPPDTVIYNPANIHKFNAEQAERHFVGWH